MIELVDTEGERYRMVDIRGGLCFPSTRAHGFFVIVGEEYIEAKDRRGTLLLLKELEFSGLDLDRFFDELTDASTVHFCDDFYSDFDAEKNRDYLDAYYDYENRKKPLLGTLQPAPYAATPLMGISTIRHWLDIHRLKLPLDSLVRSQLKTLTKADLEDLDIYPAINALRYAVGSFHKNPPIRRDLSYRPTRNGNLSPHGWMAG